VNKQYICRGAISEYPEECVENKDYKSCIHCKPHYYDSFCGTYSTICGTCIEVGSLEYEMLKAIKKHEENK
jgi:hypothetical protein